MPPSESLSLCGATGLPYVLAHVLLPWAPGTIFLSGASQDLSAYLALGAGGL